MKLVVAIIIVILAVVFVKKKKGSIFKTKSTDDRITREEKKRQEKQEKCEHKYEIMYSPFYKDNLFQSVSYDGKELLKCQKCGKITVGEEITTPFSCGEIPFKLKCKMAYKFKGEAIIAGEYCVNLGRGYMIADKRAPQLGIDKGDKFVDLSCLSYTIDKNDDYPIGLGYETYIGFENKEGNIIDGQLYHSKTNFINSGDLSYDIPLEERLKQQDEANNVLLKVPDEPCELKVYFGFDSVGEGE